MQSGIADWRDASTNAKVLTFALFNCGPLGFFAFGECPLYFVAWPLIGISTAVAVASRKDGISKRIEIFFRVLLAWMIYNIGAIIVGEVIFSIFWGSLQGRH